MLVAVAIAAGAGLAYEVLLLRVFSFSQWHHFASLAVSLALLGFGTAGTCLTLLGDRAVRWGDRLFVAGLWLGALGMVGAFLLPQLVSVRPLFAVWSTTELGKLLLIDFVSFVPFFGLALCLGQVFMRWPEATPRLYAADLLGAGAGSVAATVLLSRVFLEEALMVLPVLVLVTAGALSLTRAKMRAAGVVAVIGALAIAGWIVAGLPKLPLSDFKRLAYLLDLPDARVLEQRPGLRDLVTIVRSDSIRIAPALSLHWTRTVPSQDALVLGSDQVIPLPRTDAVDGDIDHLRATLTAAPLVIRPEGPVAVVGSSSSLPMLLVQGESCTWIEDNRQIVDMFTARFALPGVTIRSEPARRFLAAKGELFEIIVLADAGAEGDATSESYQLTVEALEGAVALLRPGGLVVIPLSLSNPPRYAPKLLAMVAEALHARGVDSAWSHSAFVRSMDAGLVVFSNEPLSTTDVRALRSFAEKWGFDLAALPGLEESEANRFHALEAPVFYHTARALLAGDGTVPAAAEWYSRRPATDQQPYFWHSMRWPNVPELIRSFGRRGLVWLDWSLLMTAVKLVVAGLLAALLILAPYGRLPPGRRPVTRWSVLIYFAALGLGFLLLEMVAFQRAVLFAGHPVPAASLVFAVFLIGSGLGSLSAPTTADRRAAHRIFGPILATAVAGIGCLHVATPLLLSLQQALRLTLVGALVFPMAVALGRAMPWGLRQLDRARPLIPWAWGLNGFASVLAGPLAVLLSVHFSQIATAVVATSCYVAAWGIACVWTSVDDASVGSAVKTTGSA